MSQWGKIKASGLDPAVVRIIEQLSANTVDDLFWGATIAEGLYQAVLVNPHLANLRRWSVDQTRTYMEGMNPTFEDDTQLGFAFYADEAVLALGNGAHIRMGNARMLHLDKWFLVQSKQLATQVNSFNKKAEYHASRKEKWIDRPDWKLSRIERECFGYQPDGSTKRPLTPATTLEQEVGN